MAKTDRDTSMIGYGLMDADQHSPPASPACAGSLDP